MGDVDDGDAAALEVSDDGEQALDFLPREGARGFIHHEDGGLVAEDLRDLHELGLVLADVLYGQVGVQVEAHGGQELLRLLPRHGALSSKSPRRGSRPARRFSVMLMGRARLSSW